MPTIFWPVFLLFGVLASFLLSTTKRDVPVTVVDKSDEEDWKDSHKSPPFPEPHVALQNPPEASHRYRELSSDDEYDDGKIPKPSGEVGRPGRGGYNLKDALNWNDKQYAKFKARIHRLVDKYLDATKSFSLQNPAQLKVVRGKATAAFPDLENYRHGWPVTDMVKTRLKYTAARAKLHATQLAAKKAERPPLLVGVVLVGEISDS